MLAQSRSWLVNSQNWLLTRHATLEQAKIFIIFGIFFLQKMFVSGRCIDFVKESKTKSQTTNAKIAHMEALNTWYQTNIWKWTFLIYWMRFLASDHLVLSSVKLYLHSWILHLISFSDLEYLGNQRCCSTKWTFTFLIYETFFDFSHWKSQFQIFVKLWKEKKANSNIKMKPIICTME